MVIQIYMRSLSKVIHDVPPFQMDKMLELSRNNSRCMERISITSTIAIAWFHDRLISVFFLMNWNGWVLNNFVDDRFVLSTISCWSGCRVWRIFLDIFGPAHRKRRFSCLFFVRMHMQHAEKYYCYHKNNGIRKFHDFAWFVGLEICENNKSACWLLKIEIQSIAWEIN